MSETALAREEFTVVIEKTIKGQKPSYLPLLCRFTYTWDFARNMGDATLISINDVPLNQPMFPLGIKGMLAFMGKNQFNVPLPDGTTFFAYRTLMNINKSAAFMVGKEGDTIIATSTWEDQQTDLFKASQE